MAMPQPTSEQEEASTGFAVLDDKGRLSLPKAIRDALGLHAGSSFAYIVVQGSIMIIPQDEYLAALSEHAAKVLSKLGLTVQDLLDDLPAARAETVAEEYGADFMAELERERAAIQAQTGGE